MPSKSQSALSRNSRNDNFKNPTTSHPSASHASRASKVSMKAVPVNGGPPLTKKQSKYSLVHANSSKSSSHLKTDISERPVKKITKQDSEEKEESVSELP
mmetsp:Transcript_40206/g.61373  ORF Transcript_40206/g.61373 Transcript_40206/m.61373 type:complete len:100 (+) Transcript_40206:606-905(+)|eukprot:CAMPEP_0170489892 /NCGR_PEP_ID=MMETSP0208-20121228/8192_1 /TAXON_ID=197538 /ORGANISM="Strombidium inclinatum, Strain S3" /LENGTH=99 /DNA_ID=CAMNT_0010765035 /DNA_START=602 /DNA_END=901 /DNA_ORIENTATION=-